MLENKFIMSLLANDIGNLQLFKLWKIKKKTKIKNKKNNHQHWKIIEKKILNNVRFYKSGKNYELFYNIFKISIKIKRKNFLIENMIIKSKTPEIEFQKL